jgi:ankyrin repeat protein
MLAPNATIARLLVEYGAGNEVDQFGESALWRAAENARVAVVEALLQAGAYVNTANRQGKTALWQAAADGREDVVEALVRAGADVNKAHRRGDTPLIVAANKAIATMLIERGADVNAANNRGQSAVWRAAHSREDVVEVLLQAGADVNTADANGNAPLSVTPSARIATMLIERGANVNVVNNRGQSALWQAVSRRDEAVVEVLLRAGADVNEADNNGDAPLVPAARAGFWSIVMMLVRSNRLANIDALIDDGKTALWLAVKSGGDEVVEALVKAGANVNIADRFGDAPLSTAPNKAIAKMLIERGADANAVNERGESALWWAALNGRADVVEVLLQAGADVNKADSGGYSPLSVAANATIATMIIERGVDVNAVNQSGQSALLLATMFNRVGVVEALVRAGADVSKADNCGNAPLSVAANATIATMMIERGADVNAVNKRGESVLWRTALNGCDDVVEALVQAGADVNKADQSGGAPLRVAANATIAKTLIEQGAEVEAVNNRGETALWWAIHCQHLDVVEALVQAGADVNTADENGDTPLAYALCNCAWFGWLVVAILARSNRLANVDAEIWDGKTALWLALTETHSLEFAHEAAIALICAGADVDFLHDGMTLLQVFATTDELQAFDNTANVRLLLAAGADTAGISAVDCKHYVSEMLAGGVVWTDDELTQIWRKVPAAEKEIELAGFAAIRARVLEICVALQDMEMPAPQLIEIVTHACAPFAAQLPYHYLWDAVVLVKHFRSRKAK